MFTLNASNLSVTIETRPEPVGKPTIMVTASVRGLNVDREHILGWAVRDHVVAARLSSALSAGVVFAPATVRTDVNGDTYVSADSKVSGRHMNADLKKLGF